MSYCLISRIGSYIIEYSDFKPSKQLEELKKIVLYSLDYFRTLYINSDDISDYNIIEYEKIITSRHKSIVTDGYELIVKIQSMLDIIQVTDESQTNKYKYEECSQNLFGSANFLNIFNGIVLDGFKENIEQIIDESKILKLDNNNNEKEIMNIKIKNLIEKKSNFISNSSMNVFNHYINQIILQLCRIKLIFKNTYIEN